MNTPVPHPASGARVRWLCLALLLLPLVALSAGTLHFDGSEYTGSATVIGVSDVNLTGGGVWSLYTGSAAGITTATWGTGVTGRALRINDTSLTSSQSACIDTGSTLNTAADFTVSFDFKATGEHASTGTRQAWLQFGRAPADTGDRSRNWLFFDLNGPNVRLWVHDPARPGDGFRTAVILGRHTPGAYNHFTATIDPVARRYLSVVLNGTDVTSRVLAAGSGGGIPWQIAIGESASSSVTRPNQHLWIITGTDDALTFDLDNIRLSELPEDWVAKDSDEWLPFIKSGTPLQVAAGSALDFTTLFNRDETTLDDRGFARVDHDGVLSFSDGTKVRLFTAAEFMPAIQLPLSATDAQIQDYVDQIARAGYNAFRPHFLDVYLMENYTVGSTSAQLAEINPLRLVQWQKLAARLRAKGIYLAMDSSSSWNAFYPDMPDRFYSNAARLRRLKLKLCYDEAARAHWKTAMEKLYGAPNPFIAAPDTNLALKDDPQVVFNNLRNEPGLIFQLQADTATPALRSEPGLLAAWHAWLAATYGDIATLNSAWTASHSDFPTIPLPALPQPGDPVSVSYRDLRRFEVDLSQDATAWMQQIIRGIGVKSLITDYNNISDLPTALVRDTLDLVDNHSYHDHPTDGSGNIALIMKGGSAVDDVAQNIRHIAHSRLHGRPFSVTEWGYVFWNPHRYEGGLMFPSYARLQDWFLISQHAQPVQLSSVSAAGFVIGSDPVAKASEYMGALLFGRGDVSPSDNRVEVVVDAVHPATHRDNGGLLFPFKALPLLTGFGLRVDWPPVVADDFDDSSVATADTVNDPAFGPASNFWQSYVNGGSTVTASGGKLSLRAAASAYPSAIVRNRVLAPGSLDVFTRKLRFDVTGPVFSSDGVPANKQILRVALTNATGIPYANPHAIIVEIRGDNRVTIGYKLNAPSGAYHHVRIISDLPSTPGLITGFTFDPVATDLNEIGAAAYDPAYELVLHLAGSGADPLYHRYTGRWNVVAGATPLNAANWGSTAANTVQLETQKIDGVVNGLHVTAAIDHFSIHPRARAPRAAGQPAKHSWNFPSTTTGQTLKTHLIPALRSGSSPVLPPGNLTTAPTAESNADELYADGVYHSDTGELLLEAGKRAFRVVTPRSEGVTVPVLKLDGSAAPASLALPNLRVTNLPAPHMPTSFGVLLSSLSADPATTLQNSRRLLLIVSPDALNTGMAFTDHKRTHLYKNHGGGTNNGNGSLPVLLRRVATTIRVRNIHADTLKVYPLRPDGSRRAQLAGVSTEMIDGAQWLVIPIDTGNLGDSAAEGPATCFEIETTTPLASTRHRFSSRQINLG